MRLAFCTTCMNRRWQLVDTLASNLALLRGTSSFLALLDFNSSDALGAYVDRHFRNDLRAGTLVYFRTEEPATFHMSVAKNTAHRLALRNMPDVLFNLDADNFLTPATISRVQTLFGAAPRSVLHEWTRDWPDGSFGRIALSATSWQHLGGYDETFQPLGWQDADLLFRARAAGLAYELHSDGIPAPVPNQPDDKLAHVLVPSSLQAPDAARTYKNLIDDSFIHSLRRPILLDLSTQRRFRGRLNFGDEVLV